MKSIKIIVLLLVASFVAIFFFGYQFGCTKGENVAIDIGTLDTPTNVKVDSTFSYEFDKAVQTDTVTTSTYFIFETPINESINKSTNKTVSKATSMEICNNVETALASKVECSSAIKCTLYPNEVLGFNTHYTVCLTTDVLYEGGDNFEGFVIELVTEADPSEASSTLSVSNTIPEDKATGVDVDEKILVVFSEAMDASTISKTNFYLTSGGVATTGTVSYDSAKNTATFTPSDNGLDYETIYTAVVSKNVKSAKGSNLEADYSWNFTTDIERPQIVDYGLSGAGSPLSTPYFYAVFDENMDDSATSISKATFVVNMRQSETEEWALVSGDVEYDANMKKVTWGYGNLNAVLTGLWKIVLTSDIKSVSGVNIESFIWYYDNRP